MTDASKYCLGCMEESGGIAVCPHCGYPQDRKPDSVLHLTPGLILHNRYLAGRVLGDGGFGITYIGRDLTLDSKVAIKEYFPSGVAVRTLGSPEVFPASSGFRQDYQWGLDRFLDEARLVRKFKDHPNIVRVEDFFAENSTAYMILEFLDGITLEKYLERQGGRIAFQPALNCLVWVMDALREVHAAGVLHRDISPDNIFLVRSGHVKLIDFGAARQAMGQKSMNLSVILKRGYAPAEQYETNGQQGPWTDVYATAGTLYRAITGTVPAPAPDRMNRDILAPPSALGVAIPPAQEQALMRALALRVEDRFPDMLAFENAMLGRPAGDPRRRTDPPPAPAPAPRPRIPAWLAAAGVLALALFAALVAALWPSPQPPVVKSFTAEPATVKRGGVVTLRWQVEGADKVEIEGLGEKPPTGELPVAPGDSATYRLVARGRKKGLEARQSVQVTVQPLAPAKIVRFEANPQTIKAGDPAILAWQVEGAREVSIGGQRVKAADSAEVRPKESASYTLTATGEDGAPQTAQVVVTVERPGTPVAQIEITMLAFDPPVIQQGQTTTLRWQSRGAARATIEGLGPVEVNGSRSLRPAKSGYARLTVTGPGGSATSTTTLTVHPPSGEPDPKPALRITAFRIEPAQVAAGQSAQMTWSVEGAARVVISPEPGGVPNSGMATIQPRSSNRYVLTAWDAQGRQTYATAQVSVAPAAPPVETGQAWSVAHDHDGNVKPFNPYDRNWDHCAGVLRLANGRLRYDTRFAGDSFDVPLSDIREVRTNRLNIAGMRAFHVRLASGRNFNFVPRQSPDQIVAAIQRAQ